MYHESSLYRHDPSRKKNKIGTECNIMKITVPGKYMFYVYVLQVTFHVVVK